MQIAFAVVSPIANTARENYPSGERSVESVTGDLGIFPAMPNVNRKLPHWQNLYKAERNYAKYEGKYKE
jgi:hypothetical protein